MGLAVNVSVGANVGVSVKNGNDVSGCNVNIEVADGLGAFNGGDTIVDGTQLTNNNIINTGYMIFILSLPTPSSAPRRDSPTRSME